MLQVNINPYNFIKSENLDDPDLENYRISEEHQLFLYYWCQNRNRLLDYLEGDFFIGRSTLLKRFSSEFRSRYTNYLSMSNKQFLRLAHDISCEYYSNVNWIKYLRRQICREYGGQK